MKKVFLSLIFVVIAMLTFNTAAKATTTIRFYLSISDAGNYCSMPYSGYYCIRVYVKLNGNTLCVHDQCNITNTSPTLITWVCDEALSEVECNYQIYYDICRFAPPNTLTCCENQVTSGSNYCWLDLTSGSMNDIIHIN
jgi:hypothetical protein